LRRIAIVSVGRSDYSYWRPILEETRNWPDCEPVVLAAAGHLAKGFGNTLQHIEADGWRIAACVEMTPTEDSPEAAARSLGRGVMSFTDAYASVRPAIVLLLGDRYEMFAAAAASVPLGIPLAHIAGGERTEGAIDEVFRHAMTKLSHLHFVAMKEYADRVIQMGEDPARVQVTGSPSLDNIRSVTLLTPSELKTRFGVAIDPSPALITFHPTTRELEAGPEQLRALLEALEESGLPCVFTAPNADPSHQGVLREIQAFCDRNGHPLVLNFGPEAYYSMMKHSRLMVGNSSSGIIEAASFSLPVVNIGSRQAGRVRPPNVIDSSGEKSDIRRAIARAASSEFRSTLDGTNPYGDGHAASRIVRTVMTVKIDRDLLAKRFVDFPVRGATSS
jgi:UDP-hydrolysing UDP-N-acetyl-D-glucosamine 2-epimerase